MAQVLKAEVEAAIARAALQVFADKGFAAATVAEIARAAGVSTGNVYRYYPGKAALLDAVVPPKLPRTLTRLLRQRVTVFDRTAEQGMHQATPHALASEDLLRFTLAHRLAVVVLLSRAQGSRYAGFADKTVRTLVELATAYARGRQPGVALSELQRFVLRRIYDNLVATTADILAQFDDEQVIREAIQAYGRYHLNGLAALLEPVSAAQ